MQTGQSVLSHLCGWRGQRDSKGLITCAGSVEDNSNLRGQYKQGEGGFWENLAVLKKGRGLKIKRDLAHIISISYYAYKIWNFRSSLPLWCLTFCCDARIQQIVNVAPLLTFVHVSSLICCACFQREIQNDSNFFLNQRFSGINKWLYTNFKFKLYLTIANL